MKKKKGFTIVELLVVIAILSTLATVSVVGYMSFLKEANISNDTSLVSQLNLALKADEVINGKAKTPTDVLKVTEESGYNLEKLTPTTDNYDIVWNQEINQFALIDEDANLVFGELSNVKYYNWKFVDTYENMDGFSVYLKGDNYFDSLEVNTSFDVGQNKITNLTYRNNSNENKDITIRTNGDIFNVDGYVDNNNEGDTINHFGVASYINIIKVANSSFHEYGKVNLLSLNQGRLVIEDYKETEIKRVFINTSNNNGKWKTNEDVIIGVVNEADLPKSITCGKLSGNLNEVILVAELQHLSSINNLLKKEYIKIFVNQNVDPNYIDFNAFISKNNNLNGTDAKDGFDKDKIDDDLKDLNSQVYCDSTDNIISEGRNKDNLIEEALSIVSGDGSENNPYLISDGLAFKYLESNKYYKLYNDVVINDVIEYNDFWGDNIHAMANKCKNTIIDLNNKTITSLNNTYLFGDLRNVTIKNGTFNIANPLCYFAMNCLFENIIVEGNINLESSNNGSAFVIYSYYDITFKSCINKSNITADGGWNNYNSIFLGYPVTTNSTLTFDSCINEGSLTCGTASMFFANPHYTHQKVIINNCINKGKIHAMYKSDSTYKFNPINSVTNDGTQTYLEIIVNGNTYKGSNQINNIPTYLFGGEFINGSNINLSLKIKDNGLNITHDNNSDIDHFKVNIGIYAILKNGGSKLNLISEKVNLGKQPTLKLYKFIDDEWLKKNPSAIKEDNNIYSLGNEKYYYLVYPEVSTLNGIEKEITEFSLSAFDKNDNLIAAVGLTK